MRIGIDCRMINESGIGRYIRNLLQQLQQLDRDNQYYILLLDEDYEKLTFATNFTKILTPFRWYTLAEQRNMPKLLDSLKLDLVHFPHFNVPLLYKGKFIVTIHDLIHQHFSTKKASMHNILTYKIKRFGYKKVFDHAVKKSEKIITPSNFVKNQLISEWKIDEDKILVTHEAVDDSIVALSKQSINEENIFRKYGVKPPYLFYVGNAHPHKNINGLINAFKKLREEMDIQLVLSGPDNYFWQKVKAVTQEQDVIVTGPISERELVAFYKYAACFITATLEEGFGIPVLEAMACGCPVICSDIGALREVGGDAAIYFNPKDEQNMITKLTEVVKDKALRQELVKRGLTRSGQFSWKELAGITLKTYKSIEPQVIDLDDGNRS